VALEESHLQVTPVLVKVEIAESPNYPGEILITIQEHLLFTNQLRWIISLTLGGDPAENVTHHKSL